jgi:hypothetical protein
MHGRYFMPGLDFGAPNTSRYEGEVVTYPLRPVGVSRRPVVRVKDIAANGRSLMNGTGFNAGVTADWQQVTLLPAGVFRALAMAAGTAQKFNYGYSSHKLRGSEGAGDTG